MRTLPKILGACTIAALAATAAWSATAPNLHRITVQLPGGGVEHITYTGDAAPKITIMPSAIPAGITPAAFWSPLAITPIGFDTMWTPTDQIVTAMNDELASMIAEPNAMMVMPPLNLSYAKLKAMPPGSQSYSVISTLSGNNGCTVQLRSPMWVTEKAPWWCATASVIARPPRPIVRRFFRCLLPRKKV
jgi:hypothetical protein